MGLQSTGRVQAMTSRSMQFLRRLTVAAALCAGFVGLAASPASARVFIGIGIPFPGYYPAPYYYPPPPPVYYAPPPPQGYYAPPQGYAPTASAGAGGPSPGAGGQICSAGPYVCPMDRPVATGGSCYCLGNGGQRVSGQAN